jgi:hypothetical protein
MSERASDSDDPEDAALPGAQSVLASDETAVRVDRSRAVMLSGRDASKFMGQFSSAAKTGRRIRSGLVVGDVFVLVPSAKLKKGLRDGTLRAAKAKNGDASVVIKHVTSGKIAGHARLQKVDVPLNAIGGAGLSAISFAIEQKQLAEIAKRLDQIEVTADEARKLQLDKRAAAARGARRVAAEVRSACEMSGRVPDVLVKELRDARASVEQALDMRLETVERHLQEYEDDKIKGKQAETYFREDFLGLSDAVAGLAQANAALVSIPYATEQEREEAQVSAIKKLEAASDAVGKAVVDCLRLSGARDDARREFQERLQRSGWGRLPSWMQWTLWEAPKGLGSFKALQDVRPWDKPKKKPLPQATLNLLREASYENHEPRPLVAEVVDGNIVLIGPAAPETADA